MTCRLMEQRVENKIDKKFNKQANTLCDVVGLARGTQGYLVGSVLAMGCDVLVARQPTLN